jgi:hypothetical protein
MFIDSRANQETFANEGTVMRSTDVDPGVYCRAYLDAELGVSLNTRR